MPSSSSPATSTFLPPIKSFLPPIKTGGKKSTQSAKAEDKAENISSTNITTTYTSNNHSKEE